jgi:hypothetical protein
MERYFVARHPEWKRKSQLFRWAVFAPDGTLFEGFRERDRADDAAKEYNALLDKKEKS